MYSNAKVYLITCNKTGERYVGSTCLDLEARLKQHKANYKQYLFSHNNQLVRGKGYTTSFKIMQTDDCKIELLEQYSCETLNQLRDYERKHLTEIKQQYGDLCVNKNIPNRTQKEYYIDNRTEYLARQKIYDDTHREKISKRMKAYYQAKKLKQSCPLDA